MKISLSFLVVVLLATSSYGSAAYEKGEVDEDDATTQYWRRPVGYLLEIIGKWLQRSAEASPALYAAEDAAGLPQVPTIEHIRRVARLLNKVANAVETGEKVDLFE